jgi:hypothetical protein
MIPIIGAPFGAAINFQLANKLARDAMNAFRMRWYKSQAQSTLEASRDSL